MQAEHNENELGARVRQLRKLRHMNQQQLAERAGVTPGFLSQLERGKTGATVATARRLASALGIRFTQLFDTDHSDTVLLRARDLPELGLTEGYSKRLLSPPAHPNVEIYSITLQPGQSSGEANYVYGDADEFLMCTHGRLSVTIGSDEHQISEGDVLQFRSSSPHRMNNRTDESASAMIVVTPPLSV
ncbi:transcriptional regulator with XRE-family HTH domain [Leucobacter exalbidus]|uniref:Transcriptional regulator with XRE-family HTH domain n=1 Tax=Leucobacter exalbidus TaxID=662960 RepID=A0A940T3R8_9MICO|nr:XRE family transcriptional regulator [Leucobacter exalbidus]MBP1326447.1 transcriptional regulator with XRE-family HTH domain [Leucobacter exalbidus]